MKDNRNYSKIFVVITDFILIDFCLRLAYVLRFGEGTGWEDYYLSFFVVFNLAWVAISLFCNVYEHESLFDFKSYLKHLFYTLTIHILLVGWYIFSFDAYYFSRLHLLYTYTSMLVLLMIFHFLMALAYDYYQTISYNIRNIVVVGAGVSADSLYQFFLSQEATVHRFMDESAQLEEDMADMRVIKERLTELKEFCLREQIDEIYFSLPLTSRDLIDDMADFADDNFIHFRIITEFKELGKRNINVDFLGQVPIITLRKEPLRVLLNRVMKRGFDIFFSCIILLLVFPLLYPLIALAIKLESRGPIIFKQLRSGHKNKDFTVYKFRTMYVNHGKEGRQAELKDCRVTRVGSFLRKTSLDELPQFINVLMGHMSVVGPRPHMLKHTEEYAKMIDKYLFRHFIMPGITGYAQVNGYRGETSDPKLMQKRIEYDTWYIENWSFFLDLKIIFRTIWNIFRGEKNAY